MLFRSLIGIEPKPELLDAPQSLKLRCVDQTHHQFAFVSVCAKPNNVMDRISINSFGQRKFLVDMDSIRDIEFITLVPALGPLSVSI